MIEEIIKGDLLKSKEKYIAQQCNCVTVKSHGLSAQVSKKYPWADVYSRRKAIKNGRNCAKTRSEPGTIQIDSNGISKNVIHMFAQYCPGKNGRYAGVYGLPDLNKSSICDNKKDRLKWFKECLEEIEKQEITRVAMPYLIGCGLAGGHWPDYRKALEESPLEIILYKFEP